jgi:hypothetical protein
MVKCVLCGRELKTLAALSGHMQLAHPSASTVDGHELEDRLSKVERELRFVHSLVETMLETQNQAINVAERLMELIKTRT